MLHARVIPCLLLRNGGLVKTVRFDEPRYVGDPINAVRIFNEKEVDELVFLDISARAAETGPNFELLADIASEAFMPFGYGGGVRTIDQVKRLYALGVEKVIINSAAVEQPGLVTEAASLAGISGVVVSIDVRRNWRGRYSVHTRSGRHDAKLDPVEHAQEMEKRGAGEILLNAIDRDGMMEGYDLELVRRVAQAVSIPVVAAGGAGSCSHLRQAVDAGASAAAAGSMFVFHGKHRAVLITYPDYYQLEAIFK
ncbi:AglZ/HisF2 family acetamidino modification protein [Noviherbaspirillum galbum]|uniref:imidazole glycerol-phosphate synthase n=1 Tax=Noviherbaspirillum galbum TaxID=2709383 RepID=A0A6B3STD2_9BURK|nr:AglZ/HisF2 family acetamidino modification protein [Noviherbaspirillum galbum]NEX64027.1 imidazole glycerol phosphate synthase subunit HisF [Noviherbaspirillum galbum]